MKRICLLFGLYLLASCTHMPLTSMWQLKGTDPLAIAPEQIALIARLPQAISLEHAQLTMQMGLHPENENTPERLEFYQFQISPDQNIPAWIVAQSNPTEALYRMMLKPEEAARLKQMQAWMLAQKAAGVAAKRSLGVHISHVCLQDTTPNPPLLANFYVQFEPQEDFILLLKNLKLDSEEFDWQNAQCSLLNAQN